MVGGVVLLPVLAGDDAAGSAVLRAWGDDGVFLVVPVRLLRQHLVVVVVDDVVVARVGIARADQGQGVPGDGWAVVDGWPELPVPLSVGATPPRVSQTNTTTISTAITAPPIARARLADDALVTDPSWLTVAGMTHPARFADEPTPTEFALAGRR